MCERCQPSAPPAPRPDPPAYFEWIPDPLLMGGFTMRPLVPVVLATDPTDPPWRRFDDSCGEVAILVPASAAR